MVAWRSYIEAETLSVLREETPGGDSHTESYKLGGHRVTLGVKKAN